MKNPVMQRSMFIAVGQGPRKNDGILSGLGDDTEEGFEDRRPDNLEIIANNLRGDIRSLDERYLELAQMVGESAFDTPEEVLALMQGRLPPAAPQQVPGMPEQGPEQGMPQEMPRNDGYASRDAAGDAARDAPGYAAGNDGYAPRYATGWRN
jgi:hypothetical protein